MLQVYGEGSCADTENTISDAIFVTISGKAHGDAMGQMTMQMKTMSEGDRKNRTENLRVIRHDSEEFLFVDLAVLIKVEFINHGLPGDDMGCQYGHSIESKGTHSSSSSNLSPISFATLRKFRRLILPVLSSSNSWKARRISSIGSRASISSLTAR